MGKTRKDLFEMWNETGKWPEVRDFLFDCFSKLVTQKEICERIAESCSNNDVFLYGCTSPKNGFRPGQ